MRSVQQCHGNIMFDYVDIKCYDTKVNKVTEINSTFCNIVTCVYTMAEARCTTHLS